MTELAAAGLTQTEAKCFSELVKQASVLPSAFALVIGESRTNTYKVLDSLVEKNLAEKFEFKNKFYYRARNPQQLLALSAQRQEALQQEEKHMAQTVEMLTKEFYQTSEQPGIRFYQGKEGIKLVFDDMLNTAKDIYLLRSPHDNDFFGKDFYTEFKIKRAAKGINTYTFSTDIPSAIHNPQQDRIHNIFRTWLPSDAYTAAVEWNIYGDKVAIISYGKEAFATVIQSAQIAESMRQVLMLLKAATQTR